MQEGRPLTILCVSSYEKGQEFIRTCKAIGCHVLLLTVENSGILTGHSECLDDIFTMPEGLPLQGLIYSVSYIARSKRSTASSRWTNSTWKMSPRCASTCAFPAWAHDRALLRDKLAMRSRAQEGHARARVRPRSEP
jgi:hypothetical protein